jgi:hypothetical protein
MVNNNDKWKDCGFHSVKDIDINLGKIKFNKKVMVLKEKEMFNNNDKQRGL